MKKRHSPVLQNAWNKKTNTFIEKTLLALKTEKKSYEKNGTAPSYKMPEAKKQTLSLKKQKNLALKTL